VRMLKTGTVPVADQINRLPAAANGESKSSRTATLNCISLGGRGYKKQRPDLLTTCSQRKSEADGRGGRGGGTGEITC
jgi:charged multivesicular body protein 4